MKDKELSRALSMLKGKYTKKPKGYIALSKQSNS